MFTHRQLSRVRNLKYVKKQKRFNTTETKELVESTSQKAGESCDKIKTLAMVAGGLMGLWLGTYFGYNDATTTYNGTRRKLRKCDVFQVTLAATIGAGGGMLIGYTIPILLPVIAVATVAYTYLDE